MIQYIIAAGLGAWLGSASKKSKKSYAEGGRIRYDAEDIADTLTEMKYGADWWDGENYKNEDVEAFWVNIQDYANGNWDNQYIEEDVREEVDGMKDGIPPDDIFAKGGKMQGYNARGDEELGMSDGKESTFKQSKKDRRDEMKGENRAAGNKTYGSFKKGGKTQGYDDKLDESLSMRDGAGRKKQQSKKDRRDESAGMEKSMGRKKYASVGTMDKKSKILPRPAKDYIAYVIDMEGNATLKYSKTFQGANRMMQNLMKKHQDISTHGISKYDPFYGTRVGKMFFEPIKSLAQGGKTQGYDDRGDEELGMTDGKESRFKQSKKDRRDEMKGENRAARNKTYGSFKKGGKTNWVQEVVDSPDFRKGAFTKKAKERGLSPEEFMRKVLKNPDKYNERTRRQAQFMKNIGD